LVIGFQMQAMRREPALPARVRAIPSEYP
jgi:hypothetical protein